MNEKYLKQLALEFPTIKSAQAEIINLSASLNLPKGTEHFISDIHGEFEAFSYVLKNSSGSIAKKIDDEFKDELTEKEKRLLASLIYYPEEKIEVIENTSDDFDGFSKWAILHLIRVARRMSSKYTRTKFKRAIKPEYEYIVEELLTEKAELASKELYYNEIIDAIIDTDSAKEYIIVFCRLIQHLAIDRLHVIGDIFDRGPEAEKVMEAISRYHSFDIEWGNHDIDWMGAACGSLACIASVIRICVKYGNTETLEHGYGISIVNLVSFALEKYKNDSCDLFEVENVTDVDLYTKVHKAITVILLKLEGQISRKHPEFGMDNRALLDKINLENGTIEIDGKSYELLDKNFPTIDKNNPYELSKEEKLVMEDLRKAFLSSERLQRHIETLYTKGSMYRVYNGNLLFHGCVPLNENGRCEYVTIDGKQVKGRALFDALDKWARKARYSKQKEEKEYGQDIMYFMWASPLSPMFGKEKMATFERYFLTDEGLKKEIKNSYYTYYEDETTMKRIFDEFGIDFETGHIINGHVPVKAGQSPVHCHGRVIVIDGGFSKVYQKVTGIAGYTLVGNSHCMKLVAHKPFTSRQDVVLNDTVILSDAEIISVPKERLRVRDTDQGHEMQELISDLRELIECYKNGVISENR